MNGDVHVHLDLVQPEEQRIRVTMRWTGSTSRQILQFPLWTPGSYTIRDPVQHLHSLQLTAATGVVTLRRLAPHQWLVDDLDPGPLCLTYVVEARDLTVRTAFVDPEFASFSLAAVVMELDGCRWTPHRLTVNSADAWQVHCPLPSDGGAWRAADFDNLLDSPVQAGPFDSQLFRVQEHQHELLLMGDPPGGWPTTLKADVERVCEATCRLMGTPPPAGDRYQLVIQMLDSGYGGLEHDHSAVLQFNWSALAKPDGYRQLLQLVGHEYLHQWNVRRLRPREFRPYDYGHPVVSEGLWFAEGITSYFDLVLPLLAGCSDRSTLLKDLSEELSRVLMAPGRRVQSLAASAQEAWVKLYKATAVSADSQISYYRLGAATAFCLDVRLRQRDSSLAEQLRALWMTHGTVGRGFVREDLTVLLKAIDPGLADDLDRWLDSADSLPLQDTAALIGARFDPVPLAGPDHGLTLADVNGRVVVKRVALDSPGRAAALVPGDELIAVDGRRVNASADLPLLLSVDRPAVFTYARRGCLATTQLCAVQGVERWCLSWEPAASSEQLFLRDRWFRFL